MLHLDLTKQPDAPMVAVSRDGPRQPSNSDAGMRDILISNFDTLGLSAPASDFLIGLWDATQFFDDVKDGDRVSGLNDTLWFCLVGMHLNPFFQQHAGAIIPVVGTAICKWHAANDIEGLGRRSAWSFSWRAGYYDVVMAACIVEHGHDRASEMAATVCQMMGESFGNYMQEGANA